MDDKLPQWDCRNIKQFLSDGHSSFTENTSYISGISSDGVYHAGDGVIKDVVISGIKTTIKNNELEFSSSYLMSMKQQKFGDVIVESPVVVECKSKVPFIEHSGQGYTSKYCFYNYKK